MWKLVGEGDLMHDIPIIPNIFYGYTGLVCIVGVTQISIIPVPV